MAMYSRLWYKDMYCFDLVFSDRFLLYSLMTVYFGMILCAKAYRTQDWAEGELSSKAPETSLNPKVCCVAGLVSSGVVLL